MSRSTAILIALALALAGDGSSTIARAQEVPSGGEVIAGDRIRFVAPPEYPEFVSGEITSLENGLLRMDRPRSRGGPVEVGVNDIAQLELSISRTRQTLFGLGIGAAVGTVFGGLLSWAVCKGPDTLCDDVGDYAPMVLAVAAPLSALGGIVGYLTKKDVWKEVSLK
jgi:hypothetical protein